MPSTSDSRKLAGAGCDILRKQRLALAFVVKSILNGDEEQPLVLLFIESGTLLP